MKGTSSFAAIARPTRVFPDPLPPMTFTRRTSRDDILEPPREAPRISGEAAPRALAFEAGVREPQRDAVADIARKLFTVYVQTDASLVEINPLFVQKDRSLLAGDAKLDVDDNALYRQPELAKLKEISRDEEAEEKARALGFSYVQLDGDVGIIGNGAGLVMSTLDAVKLAGGRAANFLDVGGGAKEEVVRSALEIVLANPRVRSVLINIFGGITRGDEVVKGILAVIATHPLRVPLVIG